MAPFRADHDEGPSEDDLRRFDETLGYCPECGHEVHDDADICPACGAWITGQITHEPPVNRELQQRFRILVVIAVLLGFAAVLFGLRII